MKTSKNTSMKDNKEIGKPKPGKADPLFEGMNHEKFEQYWDKQDKKKAKNEKHLHPGKETTNT